MKIEFSNDRPKCPGYYLARTVSKINGQSIVSVQLVKIIFDWEKVELLSPGHSTHFSRWHCQWSDMLDLTCDLESVDI